VWRVVRGGMGGQAWGGGRGEEGAGRVELMVRSC